MISRPSFRLIWRHWTVWMTDPRIAGSRQNGADFEQYQVLLDKSRNGTVSDAEQRELIGLRTESDRLMIRKAHAAALLRWRGHQIPPADKFQVRK